MAIISEIPEISDPLDERSSRRKMTLRRAVTAVVVAIVLIGSAFSYLHG
jgi:polysaccharide biosynthesis transport protein